MSDSDSDAHVTNDEEEEELNVSLSIPWVYEKENVTPIYNYFTMLQSNKTI